MLSAVSPPPGRPVCRRHDRLLAQPPHKGNIGVPAVRQMLELHPRGLLLLLSVMEDTDHHRFKKSSWKHIRTTRLLVIVSSPLIYACVLPFLLLDLAVTIYQAVCFPIYGIPKVRRRDYLIFDRGRLRYLNTIEKVGCVYCSYANGLLAMITEVAARTERHFCPIKHARRLVHAHSQYAAFLPYGDGRAYRQQADAIENGPFDAVPKNK
jgi:hypothetical protein